jgi:purine-binding chemotaxis protein CheW
MTDSKQPKKPKSEGTLPPFGLADDVLAADATAAAAGGGGATPTGPERIFDFADSLAKTGGVENRVREEVLETWVIFTLNREAYSLPVTHVREILRVTSITRVPHAPNPVRGVTNMRGRVLPVVDLRTRLGMPSKEIEGASRILVAESKGRLIGLLVDAVQQVIRLSRSQVQPPPPDVMTTQSDYILGVYHLQETLVILLVVDKVLLIRDSLSERNTEERRA